jgi:hypothetical protein
MASIEVTSCPGIHTLIFRPPKLEITPQLEGNGLGLQRRAAMLTQIILRFRRRASDERLTSISR